MDTVDAEPVVLTFASGILFIQLNRPRVRNAIDQLMAEQVAAALDRLDADDELRVAIIHGAGDTFCSGMDLKAFLRGERPTAGDRGLLGFAAQGPRKPVIAAVEGYALGAGFEVALACDMVVAAESAVFGLPETQRGMVAGGGGLIRLAQQLPRAIAAEIALTGRRLTAAEAHRLGLVTRVVESGQALAAAEVLAREVISAPAIAVEASKAILRAAPDWPVDEAFVRQRPWLELVARSPEARAGAAAFVSHSAHAVSPANTNPPPTTEATGSDDALL